MTLIAAPNAFCAYRVLFENQVPPPNTLTSTWDAKAIYPPEGKRVHTYLVHEVPALQELEKRPVQHGGGGLVPGKHECLHLISDLQHERTAHPKHTIKIECLRESSRNIDWSRYYRGGRRDTRVAHLGFGRKMARATTSPATPHRGH